MSLKDRLAKLERDSKRQGEEITVYHLGDDGLLHRHNTAGEVIEVLTREESQAQPGVHLIVIYDAKEAENVSKNKNF